MSDDDAPKKAYIVDCAEHGRSVMTIVCRHLLGTSAPKVGFVQITDDPNDLQAWCDDCERMYIAEGDRTERFEEFMGMVGVCMGCWDRVKKQHAR